VDQLISEDRLHDFLDSLQQDIAEIHDAIVDTWFSLEKAA
jgi:uncharacterized alpha-E superfamily protein